MTKLIQDGVGGLTWQTTIGEVFPELAGVSTHFADYAGSTVEQLMAHTARFPYASSNDNGDDYLTYTHSPSRIIWP
jgi:CubicO group peptidase (beta-lactamase class C family)